MKPLILKSSELSLHEAGAHVLAITVLPPNIANESERQRLRDALCADYYQFSRKAARDKNIDAPPIEPRYKAIPHEQIEKYLAILKRRLHSAMVSARIGIALAQECVLGVHPQTLPSWVKKPSLNQLSEMVLSDFPYRNSKELRRRVWAIHRSVLHLAMAIAVVSDERERKGKPMLHWMELMMDAPLLDRVIESAALFEQLLPQFTRSQFHAEELVRVRII